MQRVLLLQQYRDKEYNPKDILTITPAELDQAIDRLRKYFSFVIQNQKQAQAQARVSGAAQTSMPVTSTAQAPAGQPHALSAANLQQQEQDYQVAKRQSMQRHQDRSQVPAAPTSDRPPFPLNAASPQGVPQIYGQTQLTQEKLKMPTSKKRKGNHQENTSGTPGQNQATPGSVSSPDVKRQAGGEESKAEATRAHKCAEANCEFHLQGFATAAALARHRAEEHEVKQPPIEDPLEYALGAVAEGMGLNKDGSAKATKASQTAPKVDTPAESQKMAATLSKTGQTPKAKNDSATPMDRPVTQGAPAGGKAISPTSSLLKTPQATVVKTPGTASTGMKGVQSKTDKESPAKVQSMPAKGAPRTPPSLWNDSTISPDNLMHCFEGLDSLQGIGAFHNVQSLTPAYTPSSKDNGSTHSSDISEHDNLQINLGVDLDTTWNPFSLNDDGLSNGLDGMSVDGEADLFEMDWDSQLVNVGGFGGDGLDESGFDASLFSMMA